MSRPVLAVGPELPEFGSWNWIGKDTLSGLSPGWKTVAFRDVDEPPQADVTFYLKFKPATERLADVATETRLVFAPVDVYGSVREIEDDRASLRIFDAVVTHSPRLARYFTSITLTVCVDHCLRYISPEIVDASSGQNLLWVGRQCNLNPIVDWANNRDLDVPLHIVTEDVGADTKPQHLGFGSHNQVDLSLWSPESHVGALQSAVAALDIKAEDFRARHKPPAKALDFLASGIPVIVNRGGSTDLHLRTLGYDANYSDLKSVKELQVDNSAGRRFALQLREQLGSDLVHRRIDAVLQSVFRQTTA